MSTDAVQVKRRLAWLRMPRNVQLFAGCTLAALIILTAIFATMLRPHDPGASDLTNRFLGLGSPGHPLGTDELGRDVLSRVLSGFRWSLGVSLLAASVAAVLGTAIGLCAGWSRGRLRAILTRVIDMGISFPTLVIAVVVLAVAGRGFFSMALTLGGVSWPMFARVIFAETSSVREREFVTASRIIGASAIRTVLTNVLPAVRPTLVAMMAFAFADLLIAESGLSFLGLGAPLGTPTWGNMLAEGRSSLVDSPWIMAAPATAIILAVLAANLIGDGIATNFRKKSRL
jgi:peptide/nickel transport system permease protein